ncbi:hypothetical protein V500_01961 [Pseudogymnoascus sp. VKM F-4518 (FW-2643)]|nr:hypothetical protein V500_01961 [Pseudogymnoascus sp. VKM F-4518 (FW-2643)]
MRIAFEAAEQRPRKHLTVVSKSDALRHGLVLWDEVAAEVAADFSAVTWDKELVDAMTIRIVQKPASIDTVVGTNLHIDILSDLAAALARSIGIASSANLDPTRAYPSMFGPLGEGESDNSLMEAIATACDRKMLTADMRGTLNTVQVTEEICKALGQGDLLLNSNGFSNQV